MTFAAEERPFADMFASALMADHQVVRFAENAATSAAIAEVAKPKAEKPAPTTAVITIGEYTQNVNLARFTPWWGALVASCDNDGVRLAAEIKARLGFGA
jgi:hypothetical protein